VNLFTFAAARADYDQRHGWQGIAVVWKPDFY
jgi:hypothetical protein